MYKTGLTVSQYSKTMDSSQLAGGMSAEVEFRVGRRVGGASLRGRTPPELCVSTGNDAEENQARCRGLGGGSSMTPPAPHAPPPAGHDAEEARQGAPAQHGAERGAGAGARRARGAPRRRRGAFRRCRHRGLGAARAAPGHLNLAQRAPHLTPAPASGSRPARAPDARCLPYYPRAHASRPAPWICK